MLKPGGYSDAGGRVRGINPRYWTLVFPTDLPGITIVTPHEKEEEEINEQNQLMSKWAN